MPPHSHNDMSDRASPDLRVAYQAQEKNNSDSNDQHSTSGASLANSAATPSSVYMPSSVALSRDNMSDLSGVSGGTHRGSGPVPGQILDPKSLQRPWKQAYTLSNVPPESSPKQSKTQSKTPSIWVAENDVVEIFDNLESSLGLDRFQIRKHDRIPIMVLLMDPSKQTYELMQIWVDRSIDSIRDLVQVLQHKLPSPWKQAYDGLFQVRGNRFTQLINIIKLVKYDLQPNEILIAKPWSMAAKVTIAIAGSAIRHLTRIGVIASDQHQQRRKFRNEDAPLLLSKTAQDRAYFPEGILDHHHAMQFITFSPSFEKDEEGLDLNLNSEEDAKCDTSNYDAHSSLLGHGSNKYKQSSNKFSPNILSMGVRRVMRGRNKHNNKHNSNYNNNQSIHEEEEEEEEDDIQYLVASETTQQQTQQQTQPQQTHYYSTDSTTLTCNNKMGCFSRLNCLRNSGRDIENSTKDAKPNTTLSEEDEKRWLAYSLKVIDEDQSLANDASVVSMSAPLLSNKNNTSVAK